MKWMDLKNYLAPNFLREIDEVSGVYMNLIVDIHNNTNCPEKSKEYFELKSSINERIDEIDKYFEMNFDKPYSKYFHKGKVRLRKLLMYEPELIGHIDIEKDYKGIIFGINPKMTEREESISINQSKHFMSSNSIDQSNMMNPKASSTEYNPPKNPLKSQNQKKEMMSMTLKKNKSSESDIVYHKQDCQPQCDEISSKMHNSSIQKIKANQSNDSLHNTEDIVYDSPYQGNRNLLGLKSEHSLQEIKQNFKSEEEGDNDNNEEESSNDIIDKQDKKQQEKMKTGHSSKLFFSSMSHSTQPIMPTNKSTKTNPKITNKNEDIEAHKEMELNRLSQLQQEAKEIIFRFQLTESEYRFFLQEKAKMVLK